MADLDCKADAAATPPVPVVEKRTDAVRLAIIATHPVQYHTPLYRALHARNDVNVDVIYLDRMGLEAVYDKSINAAITWDMPLLDGYRSTFVKNFARNRVDGFLSRVNPGLFEALAGGKYDVALVQGYATASSWLSLAAARRNRLGIVWRGEVVTTPATAGNKSFKHKVRALAIHRFFRRCDTALYTCSGNKRFLQDHGWSEDRLYPFLCAIDNDYFRERRLADDARENARKDLGIGTDDVVITFCGRLNSGKRTQDIIKAIAKTDLTRAFFLVIGDGPERKNLEVLASDLGVRMYVTGFVNQSGLAEYYSLTDVAVLASQVDRSPKFINEVMNFEVPILVSDGVGTADDLVIEGQTGHVFPVGDIDGLSARLREITAEPARMKAMGAAAGEHVSRFTFDAETEGLVAACKAAAKRQTNQQKRTA